MNYKHQYESDIGSSRKARKSDNGAVICLGNGACDNGAYSVRRKLNDNLCKFHYYFIYNFKAGLELVGKHGVLPAHGKDSRTQHCGEKNHGES